MTQHLSELTSMDPHDHLSEYLGEQFTTEIVQNMENMDFNKLVEFQRSLEIISQIIQSNNL